MQRDRLRFWIVTAAALAAMLVTASLGRWQLSRAAQKEALAASMLARAKAPALAGVSLLTSTDTAALLHRRVEATGSWIPERTVYLDNRQMHGRPGFFVLTPLRLKDRSDVVVVQRGWVPRNFEDRTRVPEVSTPAGLVTVQGLISPAPSRLYEFGPSESGTIRQNLDLAAYGRETGLALSGLTILQTGDAADGLMRDWPPVDTGVDKHYGYAFQWFGLCALIAVLYVWFQIIRRFKRRVPRTAE